MGSVGTESVNEHRQEVGQAPGVDRSMLVLERRAQAVVRDVSLMDALLERIDPGLRDRLRSVVSNRVATTKAEAIELVAVVADHAGDPASGWAWLHALRTQVDDLLDECVRLLAGAAARTLGLDDGYCELADALIDELVATTPVLHWGSFTIMGRCEQFSRASRMIEVRAPAASIWELPVVVHELGHFVGPMLVTPEGFGAVHPLDELFDAQDDRTEQSWSWMQELFADSFATYVIGPAYGFACCLEVLDPLLSHTPTDSHPPAEQRMRIILATLRASGAERDRWAAERIGETWAQLVAGAGGAEGHAPVDDAPYGDALVRLVAEQLPISRWAGWAAALDERDRLVAGDAPVASGTVARADVVNGAWLARRQDQTRLGIETLGRRAVERLRQLNDGGH